MNKILAVIVLALNYPSHATTPELMDDAIEQPVISRRCKELFEDRASKIKYQQRLQGLLQRNSDLSKKVQKTQTSLLARTQTNEIKIKNELHLGQLQIKAMEENIVRSGCPGLSLEN